MDQDSLQTMETVPTILSRTMDVVNGPRCGSPEEWWEPLESSLPTSTQYLPLPSSYAYTPDLQCSAGKWDNRFPVYTPNTTAMTAQCYPSPAVTSVYPSHEISPAVTSVYPSQSREISPAFPSPPPYPYSTYPNVSASSTYYSSHSTSPIMDDLSPLSSPESLDSIFTDKPVNGACSLPPPVIPNQPISCIPPPLTPDLKHNIPNGYSPLGYPTACTSSVQVDPKIPSRKTVRMPQRKGGIQLWQFLYALLCDKQHSNIIEWTSNRGSNEFRMLEPESIAVWWGTIKSKPTMTYDKFSRSLRYYYHKGILRKIQGERYMYRFLVDPEEMYRHIGATDKRPELKNMPKEAKMAMGIFHRQNLEPAKIERTPIVTKPPEGLQNSKKNEPSKTLKLDGFGLDFNNSNNINVDPDLKFSLSQAPLPILIPTVAW